MTFSIKDMTIYASSKDQKWHRVGKYEPSLASVVANGGMVYIDGNTLIEGGYGEVDIYVNVLLANEVNEDDRTNSLIIESEENNAISLRLPYVHLEKVVFHIEWITESQQLEELEEIREMLWSRIDSPILTPEEIEFVDSILLLSDL